MPFGPAPNERQRCAHLLETRERGFRLFDVLRKNRTTYALHLILMSTLIALGFQLEGVWQSAAAAGSGMLAGALLRDLGWLRRVRQNWPLTERITDWHEVERIAGTRSSPGQTDQG